MSVIHGFNNKWAGLDNEKDLILIQFPGQLRQMDTYFAEDTKLYYFRWDDNWILLNAKNKDEFKGSSGTSGDNGISGTSGISPVISSEIISKEFNINDLEYITIDVPLSGIFTLEYLQLICNNSFPQYPIYQIDKFNNNFIIQNKLVNDYKPTNKIVIENSSANDGTYTIVDAVEVNDTTEIKVFEPIPSSVIDGNIDHAYIVSLFDISIFNDKELCYHKKDNILFNTKLNKDANIDDEIIHVNDYNTANYNQNENSYSLLYINGNEDNWYNVFGGKNSILNINKLKTPKSNNTDIKMVFEIKNMNWLSIKDELTIKLINKSGTNRSFTLFYKLIKIN
jgi:hypothetical protein